MKHEVFILGGQRIDQNLSEEQEGMVERLGEMRKGRREKIEKGGREEKDNLKEGLRDPPLLQFLDPTLRCSHCFFKSSGYDIGAQASKFVFTSL